MKGISPMIAVVLLIAFVVAVGGILSVWLSTLTTTQTQTVESATEKQIKCAASSLAVNEVRYPGGVGEGIVNITVTYDTGTEILSNLTVYVTARGNTNSTTSNIIVYPGESRAFSLNASYPPELVRARGYCQDAVAIVGECRSGEPCMKTS